MDTSYSHQFVVGVHGPCLLDNVLNLDGLTFDG